MTDKCIIALNGLPVGVSKYSWNIGVELFQEFDNQDIKDADISVSTILEKSGSYFGLDIVINGKLSLVCDRCLQDLQYPVEEKILLSCKFGQESSDTQSLQEGEREIFYIALSAEELDLRQIIYDYILLSLPIQRVHPEGQCDSKMLSYLNGGNLIQDNVVDNSPFSKLKGLLDNDNIN